MQYSLGIDAGGTYTDAILIKDSDGQTIDSSKALTTYPDLLEGISNAIDGIDSKYLKDIKLVSVSTTLATNTVLEGTGYPVGLILVGEHSVEKEFPTNRLILCSGGHDHDGYELSPLDLESIIAFAEKFKNEVSAFAVSSYFSIRNPEHELKVKETLQELTGLPVVCGHELSQDIGAYERAVTAYLNAQLIPIARQFINAIIYEIKRRGMDSKLLMLKCDGSVVGIKDALDKPIETIFSGPAASLIGASYLTKLKTCAVVDVGGTSTDVSFLVDGTPELSESGAVVGGWKTRVRATRMETSAMGGDSHIWTRNKVVSIGPRRVMPICLAAAKYPDFLEKLRHNPMPSRSILDENIQPTKFFVRSGLEPVDLTVNEEKVYAAIDDSPNSYDDLTMILKKPPSSFVLGSLIQKRLVQAIGFTPTDVLHVLGEYTQWNAGASIVAAEVIAKLNYVSKYHLCEDLKTRFAENMARDLMYFLLPGIPREAVERIVKGDFRTKFMVEMPVVLLGGPVSAYQEKMENFINADIVVPEYANVGNAAGALFGKGIKRVEILIRPVSLTNPDEDFLVFSPGGREVLKTYTEALEYAEDQGRSMVLEYMKECGIKPKNVHIEVTQKSFSPEEWKHSPMETKLTFVGVGIPMLEPKAGQ